MDRYQQLYKFLYFPLRAKNKTVNPFSVHSLYLFLFPSLYAQDKMFFRGLYAAFAVGVLVVDVFAATRSSHLGAASHRKQERAQNAVKDATNTRFLAPRAANTTSRFLSNTTESQ